MDNINELQIEHRRGRILAILQAGQREGTSKPILLITLREFGYRCDEDTFAIDCSWLARQGLMVESQKGGLRFFQITNRGRDVISGQLGDFPGVQLIEN